MWKAVYFKLKRKIPCLIAWLVVFCLLNFLFTNSKIVTAEDTPSPKVAVIISNEIRPYVEAAEGFTEKLRDFAAVQISILYLNKYNQEPKSIVRNHVLGHSYDQILTIGPTASRLMGAETVSSEIPLTYSIVLNPDKIPEINASSCGISLNIPVRQQLSAIRQGFPEINKIGLLFDPANNSDFFNKLKNLEKFYDLNIVPLYVESKQDIPDLLKTHLNEVEALWLIPDRTVISESIVQYIIKQGLLKNRPTIGYNKFFFDSGAALSFVFDYRALGAQAAELIFDLLERG